MKLNRIWSIPNKWTFQIEPIKDLLMRYVGDGKGWVDPFAGMFSPAEFTNDINIKMPAKFHLDSLKFVKQLKGKYNGVIFDPPYSCRQISECYSKVGLKASQLDTSANFYKRVIDNIYKKIKVNGYAIRFGWNSNGFGDRRGFKLIEILLIAHGGAHNDTICTVEEKVQGELF